jgi:cation diffusion facilitator family transporter
MSDLPTTLSMPPLQIPSHSEKSDPATVTAPITKTPSVTTTQRATSTALEPSNVENDAIPRHSTASGVDLENHPPDYSRDNDPYQLSGKLKTDSEIDLIRANTSRKRDGYGPITLNKEAYRAKKLQNFYENQNENIHKWLKPVDEHIRQAKIFEGENHLQYQIAVRGSFAANLALAVLQCYAAISAGSSLSLFTTMADAIFDPMSNVTLIICNRAVKRVDPRRFPSGKARIETAGNIVFCFLMTAVSWIIIVLSLLELKAANQHETKSLHLPSVIAVAIAGLTKLALFCYCWTLRNVYSQIRILWEDHRNDLFINGFGLLTSVGGSRLKWWIDPMGAIILSVLISYLWLSTAYSEFQLLIGVTADTQMQQWITYIAMTHSPDIVAIDTVRAYHSGPRIIVEVDIVMDPAQTLRMTHDVAEELQMKLESLPDVERAYVHIDFETSHKPEHFWKKEL